MLSLHRRLSFTHESAVLLRDRETFDKSGPLSLTSTAILFSGTLMTRFTLHNNMHGRK